MRKIELEMFRRILYGVKFGLICPWKNGLNGYSLHFCSIDKRNPQNYFKSLMLTVCLKKHKYNWHVFIIKEIWESDACLHNIK